MRITSKVAAAIGAILITGTMLVSGCASEPSSDMETANSLAEAQRAYQVHDFATEMRILKRLASQGVAEAEDSYGSMYYNAEEGIPQDYRKALHWFRRAAAQGDVWAQLRLAEMYYKGEGVAKDITVADMWWNVAARDNETVPEGPMTLSQVAALERNRLEQVLPLSVKEKARAMAARCRASEYKTCD